MTDDASVKAAHEIATTLRNKGYTVGFDGSDLVDDFDEHIATGQQMLEPDDLSGFFVVAHRDGQTDYSSSIAVEDNVAFGVLQIEMLGAHFRTVLDTLPLDTTTLVEAMVDEAITIDHQSYEDDEERGRDE